MNLIWAFERFMDLRVEGWVAGLGFLRKLKVEGPRYDKGDP